MLGAIGEQKQVGRYYTTTRRRDEHEHVGPSSTPIHPTT